MVSRRIRGRTRRSHTIGLIGDEIVTTPFAGKLVLGAQEVALTKDTIGRAHV